MENRTLEIKVMSATGLNKVNLISKMDVYVVVYITGAGDKNKQKNKTPVNINGDTNPSWNCPPFKFTVDEVAARQNRLTLIFQIRCERALGDGEIGEVQVPVRELLDSPAGTNGKSQFVNYQVRKPNGIGKGQLTFSYKFLDQIQIAGNSVGPATSYPTGSSSVYLPPSMATGSCPPPPKYESAYPTVIEYPVSAPPSLPRGAYPPPLQEAYPPPPPQGVYPPPLQEAYRPPPSQGAYPQPLERAYGYGHQYPPPPQDAYGHGHQYPPPPSQEAYGYGVTDISTHRRHRGRIRHRHLFMDTGLLQHQGMGNRQGNMDTTADLICFSASLTFLFLFPFL